MTVHSIGSDSATNYAEYLDAKATPAARGDYYLGRDGLPTESPGKWHGPEATLARLGIDPAAAVAREALEALMEGRAPGSTREQPRWLRPAGADGTRAAGLDVTFSAPKSVSIAWALASAEQRSGLETAHRAAVSDALAYLQTTVPMLAVFRGRALPRDEVPAAGLLVAEFLHTTARGVGDEMPDPQLHSHCVVTSVVRRDGTIAAARSRPAFRAAREVGAFYRAALAQHLQEDGYAIDQSTGKDGRYFELAGIGADARAAFSKRSEEVRHAAERFRAQHGRPPVRGELRRLKLASRQTKRPLTRGELDETWQRTAATVGIDPRSVPASGSKGASPDHVEPEEWKARVGLRLTTVRATFTERELRATVLEQAPGRHAPSHSLALGDEMRRDQAVLSLEGELLTTARQLALEERTLEVFGSLAQRMGSPSRDGHRAAAEAMLRERLGGPLSADQSEALRALTGPERAGVLIGPAGTGKGVVIDAIARTEQLAGRRVIGVAVSGSTAERLGRDSPALEGVTLNVDALLARSESGQLLIDRNTTVVFDEAGMADTDRLNRLVECVAAAGAKLLLIGDARQLASIGPGGLFEQASRIAPTAKLRDVRRTLDPAEQRAWGALRAGHPERAMAHYRERGQLHLADTRDAALEAAVQRYDQLAQELGVADVALMTDGPNHEVHRMNARAQRLRALRGEVGDAELALPDLPYGLRTGDRVTWTASQRTPGQPRVENGSRGDVTAIDVARGSAMVRLDGTARTVTVALEDTASLQLAYAQHLYRQQGATVQRSVSLTGGWQTTREGAYVQASRARSGTDWHVAREDLGTDGDDAERLTRLAAAMGVSGAQVPAVHHPLRLGLGVDAIHQGEHLERRRAVDADRSSRAGFER